MWRLKKIYFRIFIAFFELDFSDANQYLCSKMQIMNFILMNRMCKFYVAYLNGK